MSVRRQRVSGTLDVLTSVVEGVAMACKARFLRGRAFFRLLCAVVYVPVCPCVYSTENMEKPVVKEGDEDLFILDTINQPHLDTQTYFSSCAEAIEQLDQVLPMHQPSLCEYERNFSTA